MLRHLRLHRQIDRRAEAPLGQRLLDGRQEVAGLVGLYLDVGVAQHPEGIRRENLDAGEEQVEMRRDHLLDPDEGVARHAVQLATVLARPPFAQRNRDQPAELLRHLDAREEVARDGVA